MVHDVVNVDNVVNVKNDADVANCAALIFKHIEIIPTIIYSTICITLLCSVYPRAPHNTDRAIPPLQLAPRVYHAQGLHPSA